jgi:galactokinase
MQPFPLPKETAVVIMDTMTRHSHTDSGYNERRASCEKAAHYFGASHLRDVSMDQLNGAQADLDEVTFRRARHVITENQRVLDAVQAMKNGDAATLGKLMNASHASLRDDFEVTNEALNVMSRIARSQPRCFGARMTGGGFGGCVVALVATSAADDVASAVADRYKHETGLEPQIYICEASAGVEAKKALHEDS